MASSGLKDLRTYTFMLPTALEGDWAANYPLPSGQTPYHLLQLFCPSLEVGSIYCCCCGLSETFIVPFPPDKTRREIPSFECFISSAVHPQKSGKPLSMELSLLEVSMEKQQGKIKWRMIHAATWSGTALCFQLLS